MDDPEFVNDEKILLRTGGVSIKAVPFEATLTNRRIILVDRAKNALPQRDIPLYSIRQILPGENAIRDPTLTVYVAGTGSETRQMILTFSREAGGNRTKERDEWVKFLEYYMPRATPPAPPRASDTLVRRGGDSGITPSKKRIVESPPAAEPPREARAAAPAAPQTFFCNRCGNRVTADSAFCNKCGSPVVPPASTPPAPADQAPAYRAPQPSASYEAPVSQIPAEQPTVDSVRIAPQAPSPVRPPVRPTADTRQESPVSGKPARASQKTQKQGFIPRLFSPKARSAEKRAERAAPADPFPEKPRRGGRSGSGKKIILAAVILVAIIAVIGIGAVVVYPMISSGGLPSLPSLPSGSGEDTPSPTASPTPAASSGQTTPAPQTSWTPVVIETAAATIPPTGVQVHVNYIGGFKGSYGMPSALQSVQSSGDRVYQVENATGTIQAVFEKRDGSTRHEILAEIYKDGKLLTKGSTNAAFGKVTLEVDTKTGVAKTPITSAAVGTATTTAAVTAQKTQTPTAAATTAKGT